MSQATRHFLTDAGYAPGVDFCRALLSTGEFSAELLRQFGGRGGKESASSAVADRLLNGLLPAEELLVAFCRASRQWLYLARSKKAFKVPAAAGKAIDFLSQFGAPGAWYGPFADGDVSWMVYAAAVRNVVAVSETQAETTYRTARVRWHVIAEIGNDTVALHWHNFSRHPTEESAEQASEQFEYWQYIPRIADDLAKMIGVMDTDLVAPDMHLLVLDTLMAKYSTDPSANWQHLRVRAESEGISLSARSGVAAVSDIDLTGIRALTTALAKSAASALGHHDDASRDRVEVALLKTFIQEWGTLSYEFCLAPADVANRFRGHVYFGARPESKGPDQLPHCKCFKQYGGSAAALKFFLAHLGPCDT